MLHDIKVVIPAAGLGTRLLTATKEQPKEMLPVFARTHTGELCIKPTVQIIYEQLFDYGFRQFYFVVGRSKRAIEDHFTADYDFVDLLNKKGKSVYAKEMANFYDKLSSSTLVWINQPTPAGFGNAVLMAKTLLEDDTFLVHAGDTIISSNNNSHLQSLLKWHKSEGASSTILSRYVKDPSQFGIIEGKKQKNKIIRVTRLEEKPSKPSSNLAIMPVYVFDSQIFDALEKTSLGKGSELQLTDGIMKLVQLDKTVISIEMRSTDLWIDVGTPATYWDALLASYNGI